MALNVAALNVTEARFVDAMAAELPPQAARRKEVPLPAASGKSGAPDNALRMRRRERSRDSLIVFFLCLFVGEGMRAARSLCGKQHSACISSIRNERTRLSGCGSRKNDSQPL
ncbi:hypothetical protein [Herbaspirillum sp. ST 5-3]|uniref:hypothetical protein n=1 Tax=Oxalobacteraceae TaxID=75682 RepID=UPI001FFF6156|nr:hypothetical protein [Herbaspirillum sp. ST 5-3]